MVLFRYDPQADVVYFSFREPEGRLKTREVDRRRHVDYDQSGAIVGVEFLFASEGIDLTDIPEAEHISESIAALRKLPILHKSAVTRRA